MRWILKPQAAPEEFGHRLVAQGFRLCLLQVRAHWSPRAYRWIKDDQEITWIEHHTLGVRSLDGPEEFGPQHGLFYAPDELLQMALSDEPPRALEGLTSLVVLEKTHPSSKLLELLEHSSLGLAAERLRTYLDSQ